MTPLPYPQTIWPRLHVRSAERRWVLVYALAVVFLTTLPYLAAAGRQGESWAFTGFVFGVEDGNSYIAKMLSGAAGAWLFRTPYTYLPQAGVLAYLPYLLLGKLTVPPAQHEQLVALFHMFRIAGIFACCLATYDFLAYFLGEVRWRRLGLLLATLGGGLGWLFAALGVTGWLAALPRGAILGLDLPLAYYSPEAFGFLELYGLPHLAFGRAFFLWALLAILGAISWTARQAGEARLARPSAANPYGLPDGLIAGLCLLGLGLMQPATVLVAWIVIGAFLAAVWAARRSFSIFRKTPLLWRAVWAGVIPAPLVIYTAWAFARDPVLRGWSAQNAIISPNPVYYLLAYGGLIPLVFIGVRRLWLSLGLPALLPLAWLVVLPVLAYAPVNLQRRLIEGVWVAWLVLALAALDRPVPAAAAGESGRVRRWLRPYLLILSALMLVPAFILLVGGMAAARSPAVPIFRPAEQAQAFTELAGQAAPGEVVLASYATGNALPAWTPLRVVIGHGPETVGLVDLLPQVAEVFASETSEAVRRAHLAEWHVRYVYWGPDERALGAWDPYTAPYLQLLLAVGDHQIFVVR